ncbi:MAG: hypothetical protein P1U44_04565 [Vicingaceae bacterium]|nr:hypothetical protein [Vicingaceae bacterium]
MKDFLTLMVNGNIGFGKERMFSDTHKHNSAVHTIKSSFFGTNKSQDNYVNNKRRNSGERPVNAGQK